MILPTAEGGALRAQDIRTRGTGDPSGLSGTIIRIDPIRGLPGPRTRTRRMTLQTPAGSLPTGCATRSGSRSMRPGGCGSVTSGRGRGGDQPHFRSIGGCPQLRLAMSRGSRCHRNVRGPRPVHLAHRQRSSSARDHLEPHGRGRFRGRLRRPGGNVLLDLRAGLPGCQQSVPAPYDGAVRDRLQPQLHLGLPAGSNGRPIGQSHLFADLRRTDDTMGGAVQLRISPQGDLVYVDYDREEIRRIRWYGPNQPPKASSARLRPSTVAAHHPFRRERDDRPERRNAHARGTSTATARTTTGRA